VDPYPDPDSMVSMVPYPYPDPGGQKMEKWKKVNKFLLLKCWMFSLRAECCSLDVLYGGLGIIKFRFWIKKNKKILAEFFS
jgi:hypothetical protein